MHADLSVWVVATARHQGVYSGQRSMRAGSGLMKRVPADEFARHAAEYLEGTEPVSVERDGEVIGRYVPTPNGHASNGAASADSPQNMPDEEIDWSAVRPESRATLERLRRVLQEVYAKTGMTEDELAAHFDTTKPLSVDRDPES